PRTARQLSGFFRFLNGSVPGGLASVTIALTADHGIASVPEALQAAGFPAGRLTYATVRDRAAAALTARFGKQEWIAGYYDPHLYLNPAALESSGADPEAAERVAARAVAGMDGVYDAYPRSQILAGQLGSTALASGIYRSFYPKRAGDVFVVPAPFWTQLETFGRHTANHGAPYAYDTDVPLVFAGCGIRPGSWFREVHPTAIAATLAALLHTARPSACDEPSLGQALLQHP